MKQSMSCAFHTIQLNGVSQPLTITLLPTFKSRKTINSPIEMFEGGVTQSPSKLDTNFKTWLLSQTRASEANGGSRLLSAR
uniref:Uncharacterized protein n=1 Tax=Caenorhabditis japonica TaxID=281687 RepID=A0A8R1IWB4_CAEJA